MDRSSSNPILLREKAALVPVRTLSVGWVSSVDELEREVIREALEHGAALI
jgi:DNA repair protein RadC